MGLAYNVYLNAQRIYGCKSCKTHLADHDEIISRVSLVVHLHFQAIASDMANFRISEANTGKHTSLTPS